MDLTKVLEQLKQELDHLDAAILSLERLQAKSARRGRPSAIMAEIRRMRSPAASRRTTPMRQAQRGRPEA